MQCLVDIGPGIWRNCLIKFRQCIFAIQLQSTYEKECGASFEQTGIPSTQEFGWNWTSSFREENFFNFSSMYFRYFVIISPWEYECPSFEKKTPWIPVTQECFLLSLIEIDPVILEKKTKTCEKFTPTRTKTDDGHFTWAFGSGELKPNHTFRSHNKLEKYTILSLLI